MNGEILLKVIHELYDSKTKQDEKYIFEFTDGYVFEFPVSGVVDGSVKSVFTKNKETYEIPFEELIKKVRSN